MKYKYNIAISLALVFLMLVAPAFGLVTAQQSGGWYTLPQYAPTDPFEHDWTGTLLKNESGIETWELFSLLSMSMDGMGSGEWVKMTIMWDPLKGYGLINKFDHHGYNLMFSGGTGTFVESNSYSFNVSIEGVGKYRMNGIWYDLIITGFYAGNYSADNELIPLLSGNSTCFERATLKIYIQPVGGEVISVDNVAILSPYLSVLVLVAAVSVTAAFAVKRRPF